MNAPANEGSQYSLGHWVDTGPAAGDGAFSSTGAFGFHPQIDASKATYGVLARHTAIPGTGFESATCGNSRPPAAPRLREWGGAIGL